MSSKDTFINRMWSHAVRAGQALGMPPEVIVTQWGHESAWGSSDLSKRANNYAGIKYIGQKQANFKSGMYAGYSSVSGFVNDYIRVMGLGYYDKVRSAGSIEATIRALGNSPYAEDPQYGNKLLSSIKGYKYPSNALTSWENSLPSNFSVSGLLTDIESISPEQVKKYGTVALGVIVIASLLK